MTTPRRLLDAESALPRELARALHAAPSEPAQFELEQLASRLSGALGLPLTAPAAVSASSSAVVVAATKPLLSLSAWVLSGVAIGVGLSAVGAYFFATVESTKPPRASPAVAQHAAPHPAAAAVPSEPAAVIIPNGVDTSPASSAGHVSEFPRGGGSESVPPSVTDAAVALEPQEGELSLLRRAQQAMNANPGRALALVALHDRGFPDGILAQEREVIAIDALTRLGRVQEAEARARRFSERYPGSAHAPRLRALLQEGRAR